MVTVMNLEKIMWTYRNRDVVFNHGFKEFKDDLGNIFITVTSGGVKEEGDGFYCYHTTEELSEDAFCYQFGLLAENCKTINIRKPPETKKITAIFPSIWEPSKEIELETQGLYITYGRFTFIGE